MKLVVIESPYAGNIEENVRYARACMLDCLSRNEAPFASHLLYTQPGVLHDEIPVQRALGINAGLAWRRVADLTAFYVDYGWSHGMREALKLLQSEKRPYEVRRLSNGGDDAVLGVAERGAA